MFIAMKHANKDVHGSDISVYYHVPSVSLELEAQVVVQLELVVCQQVARMAEKSSGVLRLLIVTDGGLQQVFWLQDLLRHQS
jgi:hypothetical protein